MAQSLSLFHRELKKGSAELLILSLLEARPRHGYEISQLIEEQSHGALTFNIASFFRCCTGWRSVAGSWAAGWKRPASAAAAITSSRPLDARSCNSSATRGLNLWLPCSALQD